MSKQRKIIIALLVLLIMLVLGYTFSKYVKSYNVVTSSNVAKWNFSGEIFNLKNSSTTTTISLADTIENSKVEANRIAPGTNGDFTIVIDALDSEVDIDYCVELITETSKPQNLVFSFDGNTYDSLSNLIDSNECFNDTILHTDSEKRKEFVIEWEWPYETYDEEGNIQDEIDVQDSQKSNYEFDLKITGTQSV